jgi:ribosomal protein S6
MPFYEHVYLARQDLAPAQVESLTEAFSKIIADNGGTVASNEYWGLRTIAYRIAKNRKAHYVLLNIDAPAPAVQEMERQVRPQRGRDPLPDHPRGCAGSRPVGDDEEIRPPRARRTW